MTDGYFLSMGLVERRIREKEERRKIILGAAKTLILEKGVAAFSMQDIADATELSKATLYLYFPSKEAMLEEIFRDATDYFVEYVEERLSPELSGLDSVMVLWGSYLSLYAESGDDFVLTGIWKAVNPYCSIVPRAGDADGSAAAPMIALISRVLARGVADGSLDADIDPERVARTCLFIATSLIDSVARLPRESRDSRAIREEMRSMFNLLLRGVAAPGNDRTRLYLSPDKKEQL